MEINTLIDQRATSERRGCQGCGGWRMEDGGGGTAYLITRSQTMHCTYLLCAQGFTEQVDCRHLATEHSFLIQLWCGTDETFIKRLHTEREKAEREIN